MSSGKFASFLSASALAIPFTLFAAANSPPGFRIDAVASKYRLWGSSFELGPSGTAQVRLDYIYPTYMDGNDSDRGPGAKTIAVPGLTYDATSRSVVYSDGETRAVCAEVDGANRIRSTGQCRIETLVVRSGRNDWQGRNMLDVFLRVVKH